MTDGVTQKCYSFSSSSQYANTYDGPMKSYYWCWIKGNLQNEQEEVTTDTSSNEKSNDEVTGVWYDYNSMVKFIPNSLFTTFVNLEYLIIDYNNQLETMKPEFLRNAKKLKNINIYKNSVKKLNAQVFAEANNLEHINFGHNQIESIHKLAFNGLSNLQEVYLYGNKIKNLHPKTFTSIAQLNILELTGGNNCVNEKFTNANQKFTEIEAKISSACTYKPFLEEDLAAVELELQKQSIKNKQQEVKQTEVNEKISNLMAKVQVMEAKIISQEEKRVKELADQQNKFDAMIAAQKLQMDEKLANQTHYL